MDAATAPIEKAISDLRDEIRHAELELDVKTRSLKVLESVLLEMKKTTVGKNSDTWQDRASTYEYTPPTGLINLNEFDDLTPPKKTLTDEIRDVVGRFGTQEFTIGHVDSVCRKLGLKIEGKSPKSRISVSLAKLCEEGYLQRTFTGAGSAPNKYRLKSTMSDAEVLQALANNPNIEPSPEPNEDQPETKY